jgi:SNF2 family DNA or RNA helicase
MSSDKLNSPLWKHQEQAVALSLKVPNMALFFEMGTGKTRTLINILRHRYASVKRLQKTLILSPPITLQNWKSEFKDYSKIYQGDVVVLRGSGKRRLNQFLDAVQDPGTKLLTRNKIIITNYETMQMADLVKAILGWKPEILVCDEAHRLRNHKSKRAKVVAQISDGCTNKYLLTGSPILNSVEDIFYQYRVLDGGKTFGDNFYAFRAKYMVDRNASWSSKPNYFPKFEPRRELFSELNTKMYNPERLTTGVPTSKALRVLKSECLDLPPLTKQVYPIELSKDQAKLYKEMRDEYITYVESLKAGGQPLAVVANLAITKALRLQQITSGFVKTDDGVERQIEANPRLDALRDLLEEICANNKVIVWACFKFNYVQIARLCKELGLEYREIHGDVSVGNKNIQMEEFRSDPKVKVMIANQASAGVGINLVEAAYSIFFSRNFSLEQDMQAEARNYRGGSEIHKSVTRIDLVAPETTDELIAEALAGKQNLAEKILTWKI